MSTLLDPGVTIRQPRRQQRGLTLIELIMFIMIVSVALAGVLTVLNVTTKSSADPMIRKQMLAIAEGMLEEVSLQPFTWCDPDDPQAATAVSNAVGATGCTSAAAVEGLGVETVNGLTDTRPSNVSPFDNVSDYSGLVTTTNISGTAMPPGYSASVAVVPEALGPVGTQVAAGAALRISVTVTHGSDSLVLEGYRARYSPNSLP